MTVVLAFGAFGLSGCKTEEDPKKMYADRTWLSVGVYDGGVGTQWIKNLKAEFEETYKDVHFEEGKTGVYIDVIPKKLPYERDTLIANLQAGNETADIYYTANHDNYTFYRSGVCADIDDMMKAKAYDDNGALAVAVDPETGAVAYNGTKAIVDKTDDYYVESFKQSDGKYYSLPFEDSIIGFVYDHELFIDNGWLHENGDGEVTDYPKTMNQFFALLDKIVNAGCIPFTYSPSDASFYTSCIVSAIAAQYEGLETYAIHSNYGGEVGTSYTFPAGTYTQAECSANGLTYNESDGTATGTINYQNAYLLSQMAGTQKAIEFVERLFGSNKKYLDPDLEQATQSFSETQKSFINSAKASEQGRKRAIAMIIEGEWWENEARQHFNNMETVFGKNYAYGKRDFRFMPLPGPDGSAESKSVIWSFGGGSTCFVNKKTEKKALAELWLQYSLSESALEAFTVTTGVVQGFKFDLSDEQKAQMTPFARNVYEIKRESDTVLIGRDSHKCELARNMDAPLEERFTVNGLDYSNLFNTFKNNNFTAAQIKQGMKTYYSKEKWTTAYNDFMGN